MKKYLNLLCVLSLTAFVACDNFLDTPLKGDYTSDNYYTSQESCEQAINGAYNGLYNVLQWQWVFGDVASDDAVKGGNAGDQAEILYIDDFSARADNGMLAIYWQYLYELAARANNAIVYIPKVDFNGQLRNQYLGEAKFLRAYAYFQLVNIFGEVPLKLLPQLTEETIHVGLSSVDDIYRQMTLDLNDAVNALPPSYDKTSEGRVTQGAALAMQAKVALFRQRHDDALVAIMRIEDLHLYNLEEKYEDLFVAGSEKSVESIFAIRFSTDSKVIQGNPLNIWTSPSVEGGYYFDAPTKRYVDSFVELQTNGSEDARLDASIGRDGKPWFNGTTFSESWSETGFLVKKYNENLANTSGNKSLCVIPYHYIRYADVLLMKAEVLNELGGTENRTQCLTALNRVRQRAGLANFVSTDQVAIRRMVRAERHHELAFEFHRFFDLMRYGKEEAEQALSTESINFHWGEGSLRTFYFPIPQNEKDTNNALKNK